MDINIEMYGESLSIYLELVHEAKEGRYDLTGYNLHVIEAALSQYLTDMAKIEERLQASHKLLLDAYSTIHPNQKQMCEDMRTEMFKIQELIKSISIVK